MNETNISKVFLLLAVVLVPQINNNKFIISYLMFATTLQWKKSKDARQGCVGCGANVGKEKLKCKQTEETFITYYIWAYNYRN